MSRRQLVDITGQVVQVDGGSEVLVEGQEVWEEWAGQTVEDTRWRKEAKGQWSAREQAAVRWEWTKEEERDKVYDRGSDRPVEWEKGSPSYSLPYLVTLL